MTDLEMMKHPEEWPILNILPLKRRSFPGVLGFGYEIGYIIADKGPTVFLANILDPNPEKFRTYSSFEDIVEDGWTVD
jgi:hypothetical protein